MAGAPGSLTLVQQAFKRLWKTRLPGPVKETWWRLVHNGLPLPARMPASDGGCRPCPCGHLTGDRAHHFWECPAAQGVRAAVQDGAAAAGRPIPRLSRAHIWLAVCPVGIHAGVWDIVALVAIAAMDKARRTMVHRSQFSHPRLPPGTDLAAAGAARGALHFWELLHDFAAGGNLPRASTAGAQLDGEHPFLCLAAPGASSVRVRSPVSSTAN